MEPNNSTPENNQDDPDAIEVSQDNPIMTGDEYEESHGEKLSQTLDLNTWHPGTDLVEMYERVQNEVAEAVKKENEYQRQIRKEIFPLLRTRKDAPPNAGVYKVPIERLEEIHRKLLFNGAVEACDGTVVSHDTLPITITQIGICLVSYRGDQGSWVHRIFRRDLRSSRTKDPVEETYELLENRRNRGAIGQTSNRDKLTSLARRGIMAYAERAVLLDRSNAEWLMGHGSPTPYELITGSGMPELLKSSLKLMKRLINDHRRFVFVPSSTSARELLTIGNALKPTEYAIIDTNSNNLGKIAAGHYRGSEWSGLGAAVNNFVKECGLKVVIGMYRATDYAPAQMFYAHVDHAHEAAIIAMADSILQEHRGFPLLIDLSDSLCNTVFGAETFSTTTLLAYASVGEPFRYLSERRTRG